MEQIQPKTENTQTQKIMELLFKVKEQERLIQEKDLQLNNLNSKIDNLMFLDDVLGKIRQSGNAPALVHLWNARHYPIKL